MDPGDSSGFTGSAARDPFTEELIGSSGDAWGLGPGEYGRTTCLITE